MSDQDPNAPKRSLKDRLKPHLPAATIGLVTGLLVAKAMHIRSTPINITLHENAPGTVLLGAELVKQVVQKGEAMFEIVPGLHVDIIDWGNPNVAER